MAVWAPLHVLVCAVGAVLAGVQGATAGLAIGAIIQAAVLARQVSAEAAAAGIPVGFRNLLPELNVVGQYAVPAAIAGYISVPAVWWGNLLLARQTDGFTELALYNAAWSFRVLTLIVPVNINRVAGSMLYYQQGTDDQDGFRQVFWSNVAACTGFACLAGIAVAWGRDALLRLFGSAFVAAADVLLLLLISALLEAAALGVYQIIQTQKRMWLSMLAVAIPNYATFVLVGTILVPRAGGAGLAVASIAAWAVALIAISVTALRTGLTFRAWPHASKGTLPIIQAG
jgi:O-antigen/teichoic acid export membrane protein